jgi:putative ABC transport system permease protein
MERSRRERSGVPVVTWRALAGLVRVNIRRARRSFVLSAFGIAVGVASLAFFLALSSGVRRGVLARAFPAGQLEVTPPQEAGGTFGLFSFGGPRFIDEPALAALRARPDVKAAYPRARLLFPARAWGGAQLVGRDVQGELIAEGLDPAAVAGESLAPIPFSDEPGSLRPCTSDADCVAPEYCPADTGACERPVPAVLSPFLLEMYNGAIAPSHGLPRIGEFLASRLRGFTFHVALGESIIALRAPPAQVRERRIMLVGIARRAAQLAVTLPLGRVRAWNAAYAGPRAQGYSSVLLELGDGADVTRLAAAVRALGYTVADSGAERAGLALTLMTLLFALVSAAVVAVAAINIAHSFFRSVAERRRELGLLRAVGASARDVERIVLGEALAIGLAGGVAGLVLALGGAWLVDAAAARWVPDFPFKPESYFHFGWPVLAAALGCALGACVAGAYLPARAAARLDPADALAAM